MTGIDAARKERKERKGRKARLATPCAEDGCGRPERYRGWCETHYRRRLRTGGVDRIPVREGCAVDGCPRRHFGQGYCRNHLRRLRLYGEANAVKTRCDSGPASSRWVDKPSYSTAHRRVRRARGYAVDYPCAGCGSQAAEWSYDHEDPQELTHYDRRGVSVGYSADPAHYQPRCRRCHGIYDRAKRRRSS